MRIEGSIARRPATPLDGEQQPVCLHGKHGRTARKQRIVFVVGPLLLVVFLSLTGQSQVVPRIPTTPLKAGSSTITVTPRRVWRPWRPGPQRVNAQNSATPWAYVAGASAVLAGALVVNRIVEHKQNARDWGKRGQITLASKAKVGRSSLPPGRYTVQHYADPALGNEMLFEGKSKKGFARSDGPQSPELLLITKCRTIAMDHKAPETIITAVPDGDAPRILSLQVKGEKIAHIITQE